MISLEKKIKSKGSYIIAEIGMNHDGSFGNALRLIEEAAVSGVQAVKFQLHISEEESLPNAPTPPYFTEEGRFAYFNRTAFTEEEWKKLKEYTHKHKLDFIVSPFSIKAAQILKKVGVDAYKIASGEVTNHPLLEYIASTDIPVLLSSGMSGWDEVEAAANILKKNLSVVFQCSSEYPCKPESVGLNIIEEMKERLPEQCIGFSDHTLETYSSIAALMKGAVVFEKHFTLANNMYGPDAKFSLTPERMARYVEGLQFVHAALKSPVDKNALGKYQHMKEIFEKSVVAAKDLQKGAVLTKTDLAYKKPGHGLRADRYKELLGKKLRKAVKKDEYITFEKIL